MSQYEFGPLRPSELDVFMALYQRSNKPKPKTALRSSNRKARRLAKREARHA